MKQNHRTIINHVSKRIYSRAGRVQQVIIRQVLMRRNEISKQGNDFSRRQMSGPTTGLMLKRRVLFGIAALLMAVSVLFTLSASAHDISLVNARNTAREYARKVRDDSGGKYAHYTTDCYKLYQGHNHYVRCLVEYIDDEHPGGTKRALCRETIDVYLQPHNKGVSFDKSIKHYSGNCLEASR